LIRVDVCYWPEADGRLVRAIISAADPKQPFTILQPDGNTRRQYHPRNYHGRAMNIYVAILAAVLSGAALATLNHYSYINMLYSVILLFGVCIFLGNLAQKRATKEQSSDETESVEGSSSNHTGRSKIAGSKRMVSLFIRPFVVTLSGCWTFIQLFGYLRDL
jgi:hypothetical protein